MATKKDAGEQLANQAPLSEPTTGGRFERLEDGTLRTLHETKPANGRTEALKAERDNKAKE